MTNAISGVGTVFSRSDMASSPTFTPIAEVRNISGPGMTRDQIDVTNLDSVGGYREFIAGFRDGGEITFTMNFTPAGYGAMKTDFESPDSVNYRLVLPDAGAYQIDFAGKVTGLPMSISPDDAITVDVTIKIDGQVTVTP